MLPAFSASAQYSEVGLFVGGSNFIGDVGNYQFHLPTGYAGGVFYRYNFDRHWAVRAQANYGFIQNDDANSSMAYRVNRNLSFQSEIWEGYVAAEFNFLQYEPGTKFNHTPYVTGGVGLFYFNPKTEYEGEFYELQPLNTEGQGIEARAPSPYELGSTFFMFGMGYKIELGRFTTLNFESTFRTTNTDYLDDVSGYYANPDLLAEENGPIAAALSDRSLAVSDKEDIYRGNPQNKDWYIFTGIAIQWKFDELYEKCRNFGR